MIRFRRLLPSTTIGVRTLITYRNYSISGMAREVDHLVPSNSAHLMKSGWHKRYLYSLGKDSLRLAVYQKLYELLPETGGSTLKGVVFDMLNFVKNELADHGSGSRADEFRQILYFGSNLDETHASHTVPLFKWFFIAVGMAVVSKKDPNLLDNLIEKMIEFYMGSFNLQHNSPRITTLPTKILSTMDWYYESVPVDLDLLYSNAPKSLRLELKGIDTTIPLPALPQLKDRSLLVKALIHKELANSFILPQHPLSSIFSYEGIPLDKSTVNIVRHDLSFLDGLGDFFVCNETTELVYRLKSSSQLCGYGMPTYKSIKTVFSTNAFFSRLALAYKLPFAIGDSVAKDMLLESYLSGFDRLNQPLNLDKLVCYNETTANAKYEQELLADYFEQYIGALFQEDPTLTQKWLAEIYDSILLLVPPALMINGKRYQHLEVYKYNDWCVDVIGKAL